MRKIPKFPLKMENGSDVRTIEDLKANADIRSVLNYYLNGRLLKWCKANNYNDLYKKILDLNETLIINLCDALEMKVDTSELYDLVIQNDEIFNNYIEFRSYQAKRNVMDQEFAESCMTYISSKMDISGYHITMFPIDQENDATQYWELEISDRLTDMYFKCVLSKTDSTDKLMETVCNIVKNIIEISAYTVGTISSGSGNYGYGLGLI